MPTARRLSRDEQRAQTRRDLLDAAASVFARNGYHATSVDMVAEAAGYTKGAVYSNFDSKEELFLALVDAHLDQAVDELEDIVATSTPETRADAVGDRRAQMEVFDAEWHLLETEFVLYAARNEHIRERMAERQRRIRERIAGLLSSHLADLGIADGEVSADDLARIVIATGDGLTWMTMAEPDTEGGRLMSTLLHLLERGLDARR